jgi:hypothetical protein
MTTVSFRGGGQPMEITEWECPQGELCVQLTVLTQNLNRTSTRLDRDEAAALGRALLAFAGTGKLPKWRA